MIGARAEGAAILEAVAKESTTMEAEPTTPVAGAIEGATLERGIAVAPEVRVETHVDLLPGMSTDVVVREPEIEEAAPIRSAPMSKATSTSCGGLELLDDNLIDPHCRSYHGVNVPYRAMDQGTLRLPCVALCCEVLSTH
jgi:hypothetical protein